MECPFGSFSFPDLHRRFFHLPPSKTLNGQIIPTKPARMTIKKISVALLLLGFVFLLQQCSKKDDSTSTTPTTTDPQPNLPPTAYNYVMSYPAHIQNALLANDNTPVDNPMTNDGATLGRVLFYDKHLSKNNTVSCGSCHKPSTSFSDELQLSKGF